MNISSAAFVRAVQQRFSAMHPDEQIPDELSHHAAEMAEMLQKSKLEDIRHATEMAIKTLTTSHDRIWNSILLPQDDSHVKDALKQCKKRVNTLLKCLRVIEDVIQTLV